MDESNAWSQMHRWLKGARDDPEAYAALQRLVRRWAQRAFPDVESTVSEDLVVDTCSEVILRFDEARGEASFGAFVFCIYRTVRNRFIRNRRCYPLSRTADIPAVAPAVAPEDRLFLEECLNQLEARYRSAIESRYFWRASYAEIAAQFGVSEESARQLVSRGLARLRQYVRLQSDMGTPRRERAGAHS